jgi:hypothetical protein
MSRKQIQIDGLVRDIETLNKLKYDMVYIKQELEILNIICKKFDYKLRHPGTIFYSKGELSREEIKKLGYECAGFTRGGDCEVWIKEKE